LVEEVAVCRVVVFENVLSPSCGAHQGDASKECGEEHGGQVTKECTCVETQWSYRREITKKRVSSRQKGVTDFGRPDAQRMTLPLIHMIEAGDIA
jgi:hypothetical protein